MKRTALALTLILSLLASMIAGMQTLRIAKANFLPAPSIEIICPNYYEPYHSNYVMAQIDVRVLQDSLEIISISYSLDDKTCVSLTNITKSSLVTFGPDGYGFVVSTRFILKNLSEGNHTLKAYSLDSSGNNMSTSMMFTVDLSYWSPYPYNNPRLLLLSPENQTYSGSELPLVFFMNGEIQSAYYFLDKEGIEPVSVNGNVTLTGLSEGSHEIYVCASNGIGGWATKVASFNIEAAQTGTPSILENQISTIVVAIIAITIASIIAVGIGLLVYFKKRKHARINKHSEIEQSST
jgi:hypothetical protein